jgi:hypothetical protein
MGVQRQVGARDSAEEEDDDHEQSKASAARRAPQLTPLRRDCTVAFGPLQLLETVCPPNGIGWPEEELLELLGLDVEWERVGSVFPERRRDSAQCPQRVAPAPDGTTNVGTGGVDEQLERLVAP